MTTEEKLRMLFVEYNNWMVEGIYPADIDSALEIIKDLAPKVYLDAYEWAVKNPELTMIE